jgi:pilus assembly protein CpaF
MTMKSDIQLEISRPRHEAKWFSVPPGVYSVGSDDDCKIRLDAAEQVDPRHAVLTLRPDGCVLEDLDSRGGTFVNDRPVQGREEVPAGDEIRVGRYRLRVRLPQAQVEKRVEMAVPVAEPAAPPPSAPVPSVAAASPAEGRSGLGAEPAADPLAEQRRSVKQQIHRELVERMDIKRMTASHVRSDELRDKVRATVEKIVADVAPRLPAGMNSRQLIKEVIDEAVGLGPLEDLLADDSVTEIMVNGHRQIYVERAGKIVRERNAFMDDNSVLAVIERIVSPIGRRIDESQPYVDARLPDGSRVNAIIHPLSLVGPCLTIRKFSKIPFTDQDLIRFGTLTPQIAQFTRLAVMLRRNIVVSGGTGSGKTSLLNVLSSYIPAAERIVTIEDAAELRLNQEHIVRLEARPPNIEGKGAITIRDLVRNALRMRPDRIVVGECRGGEALDMLQAMNTGHDGSLTTVHANSPRDVISRLETMVLMSGMDLPVRAIREQVAAAIDLVVHETRFSDGSRKVTRVTEVCGLEGDQITMQDIFEFRQTGLDDNGHVLGRVHPTGAVPTFIEDIKSHGLEIDRSMFNPNAGQGDRRD